MVRPGLLQIGSAIRFENVYIDYNHNGWYFGNTLGTSINSVSSGAQFDHFGRDGLRIGVGYLNIIQNDFSTVERTGNGFFGSCDLLIGVYKNKNGFKLSGTYNYVKWDQYPLLITSGSLYESFFGFSIGYYIKLCILN